MIESSLYKNIMQLECGVETCLEKRLNIPALILLYSGIDVVSWLASPKKYASKRNFIKWVDTYLLPAEENVKCTALDLYAARCGLLHTLTPEAKPIPDEKPRLICYATGEATAEAIQKTIDLSKKSDRFVAVHINNLFKAWRLGMRLFFREIEKDLVMKLRVYTKAKKFFSRITLDDVNQTITRLEGRH